MSLQWKDPRDGMLWLVEAMPFDMGPSDDRGPSPHGWTMLFASHGGHREIPVGYDLGVNVATLRDRELMTLLDAARAD